MEAASSKSQLENASDAVNTRPDTRPDGITPPLSIVLLGATGFTGGAVVRAALARGARVNALVRNPKASLPTNIKIIPGALPDIPSALFPPEPCVVVHLASKQIDHDGTGYWTANVGGTEALMRALPANVKGVIFGSSMSVYGQGAQRGNSESAPLRPNTALALARLGAEEAIQKGAQAKGIGGWLLRPRFIIGQTDQYTVPGMIKLARRRLCPGSGHQQLAIVDVEDYADLILHLASALQNGSGPKWVEPLNVSYRHAPSLLALLAEIRQALGITGSWRKVPLWTPLLAALRLLPPTQGLAIKMELIGLDHYVDIGRLVGVAPQGWVDIDPITRFRRAVDSILLSERQAT